MQDDVRIKNGLNEIQKPETEVHYIGYCFEQNHDPHLFMTIRLKYKS